jgi:uncharacterized membrane protein required for colicin V production
MNSLQFSNIDFIALFVILIGTLVGLRRGLTGQIPFLLGAMILAVILTNGFIPLQNWLISTYSMPYRSAIGLALGISVAIPVVIVWAYKHLPDSITQLTFMVWADRLGGALAGFAGTTAAVVLVFILLFLLPHDMRPDALDEDSWLKRNLVGVEGTISEKISVEIRDLRTKLEKTRETKTNKRLRWE